MLAYKINDVAVNVIINPKVSVFVQFARHGDFLKNESPSEIFPIPLKVILPETHNGREGVIWSAFDAEQIALAIQQGIGIAFAEQTKQFKQWTINTAMPLTL